MSSICGKSRKFCLSAIAAFGLLIMVPHACFADQYYDEGVKRYTKKDFKGALQYFDKAVEIAPWDANAMYYQALTLQYLKNWKAATEVYRKLADRFPTTQAGSNAVAVLRRIDPGYFKKSNESAALGGNASTGASSPSESSAPKGPPVEVTAPNQCRIPITKTADANFLDGTINGRSTKFEFSGPETTISPKDAAALGIKGAAMGAKVLVTVKVGEISERNYQITIDNVEKPRLGDDFLKQFTFTLDNNVMNVVKKAGGAARAGWDVPFRRQGKEMLVEAMVNGRRVSMVFDQSGGECVVPKNRLREYGMEANESSQVNMFNPTTNPTGAVRGEAGFGESKTQVTAEGKVQIGPVISPGVHFKVDDTAKDGKLSSSAFGEWKYDVDLAANLLRFHK